MAKIGVGDINTRYRLKIIICTWCCQLCKYDGSNVQQEDITFPYFAEGHNSHNDNVAKVHSGSSSPHFYLPLHDDFNFM